MIMMFCTTLCLIPLLVREIKARRQATYGTMQNDSVSDDSDAPSPTDATVNNGNHE
ncbi:hypothetical protein AB6A40_009078 [Gnathostoma spinigerum]|uniref:Uncharacterized protein n=1 Tax=Gnathostoma spinigerum TaxID=75299 RepID=A0ABD6EYP2_9BILA